MKLILNLSIVIFFLISCNSKANQQNNVILIEAESFTDSLGLFAIGTGEDGGTAVLSSEEGSWLTYDVHIQDAGRYKCELRISSESDEIINCWLEDYYDNKDDRVYNITSTIPVGSTGGKDEYKSFSKYGSPLNTGRHKIKLHVGGSSLSIDWIKFTLIKNHQITDKVLTQNMDGNNWNLVWSDEFDGSGLPDTSKWTYDIGNWGWGNNEPQYYTENRSENARLDNGHLIIEACKNDMGQSWTSARLTTRGKVGFVYGKIEFRAMPPAGVGTWTAGWLLGDAYRDEISWPYCGEVDILECIGREVDQETGDGINHGSCHTRAFYFKQGNHLTNTIPVEKMTKEFHTYSIEWSGEGISAFVDDEKYYTYDKLNGEWEWPFNNPQNIIINLAMGGGMGGEIDESLTSQKLIVDYIRVYEKK